MEKHKILKSFLLAAAAGGIALSAHAHHTEVSEDYALLHSRTPTGQSSYFVNSGDIAPTSAKSSLGGNVLANGSFYTSGNFNIVGVRSGAWLLDSTSLGVTFNGLYDLDITWGLQGALKLVRIEVTHADGVSILDNIDQNDGVGTWMSLGRFAFSGAAGEEVRIFNNADASSGNVQFDSIQLTAIPEPSTYAAIFGGLALVGAFVYRRRLSAKK